MNKSKIAGILSIVSGGLGIGTALVYVIMIVFSSLVMRMPGFMPNTPGPDNYTGGIMFTMMIIMYSIFAAVFIIAGILAIIGGVFALKRKKWGLALTGSIASIIAFMACGIASIIFIIMGKEEFQRADSSITSQD
jgi:hypothetical protein